MKVLSSWSGGKDSCYAMMCAVKEGHTPIALLNVMNEYGKVSRSHGLPGMLLDGQAQQLSVPLYTIPSSWQEYEKNFIKALEDLKASAGIEGVVFGDIDLQAHRDWEEKVCSAASLEAILPLWKRERKSLVLEMLTSGIKCVIVSCNTTMGEKYLGQILTRELVDELEQIGIDPCGENGEFHTLVTECPLFKNPITIPAFTTVQYSDYCFIQWQTS